jgi:hypothetical protein
VTGTLVRKLDVADDQSVRSLWLRETDPVLPATEVTAALIVPFRTARPVPTVATAVAVHKLAPDDAAVIRPCASTVMLACVYEPAVTAVFARLSVVVSELVVLVRPVPAAIDIDPPPFDPPPVPWM